MEILIKGEPKEIAALALAVQERQGLREDIEKKLAVSSKNLLHNLREQLNGK